MFFQIDTSEFSSQADDNIPFALGQNHKELMKSVKKNSEQYEWMVWRKLL